MQLSEHFSLAECAKSQTAERRGIDNTPSHEVIVRMQTTAHKILEPVRLHYGIPFSPSSFFRCLELNRAIGSKDSSQHVTGEAVDFEVPGIANANLAAWIRDNLDFDQVILEFYQPGVPDSGWIHCSYREGAPNRKQVLTIGKGGTQIGIAA